MIQEMQQQTDMVARDSQYSLSSSQGFPRLSFSLGAYYEFARASKLGNLLVWYQSSSILSMSGRIYLLRAAVYHVVLAIPLLEIRGQWKSLGVI